MAESEISDVQLYAGTETSYYNEQSKSTSVHFLELPDDVLLKIFSLLPLKSVLQLEHLCERLHGVVSVFLGRIKSLNFHHSFITQDIFRRYDPTVRAVPSNLTEIFSRCPQVNHVVYLPAWGTNSKEFAEEVADALFEYKNIAQIEFCDSWDLQFLRGLSHLSIKHVCLGSVEDSVSLPSHCNGARLLLEQQLIEEKELALFKDYVEIALKECMWVMGSLSIAVEELSDLKSLKKFIYIEPCRKRPHPTVLSKLMKSVATSECLQSLNLGLSNFQCLEEIVGHWNVHSLQSLELWSTGSYSATLEQMRHAKTVAELCYKCAHSLEHLTLPSSILVKQFFIYLLSKGRLFPCLLKLDMTGLADTKMFLAPGNMVETLYYQEFIKLCPRIESLSLHSFSGSLLALGLPLTITDLTLPWDNRLNMSQQMSDVLSTSESLVNLEKLRISGVEEVDGLLLEAFNVIQRERLPDLKIESKSLREVQISNICVRTVHLMGCTTLSRFTLHCCPSLKKLSLPASSLERVNIYDSYSQYMNQFVSEFASRIERTKSCHIHIQLHSVKRREVDDIEQQHFLMQDALFANVESALIASSKRLDFMIFKTDGVCVFQHNSGELLYPFTELHPHISSSSRSAEELHHEMDHRSFVMEGIRRWKRLIFDIKQSAENTIPTRTTNNVDISLGAHTKPTSKVNVKFCDAEYICTTNMSFVWKLNSMSHICQPSGVRNEPDSLEHLNVPRLDAIAGGCGRVVDGESLSEVSSDPLVVVSIMEYAHNIHTLFYYT